MSEIQLHNMFNRARIDDRQVNELLGLAKGMIADGLINQSEAEFLRNWLVANKETSSNPVVRTLLKRVNEMLFDNSFQKEEADELLGSLRAFSSGDIEIGELIKSSTLPLDNPVPEVLVSGQRFAFTGTFAFGSRRDCEAVVRDLGGIPDRLSQSTNYLVVGIYATDSWAHSAFGRKIEQAVEWRDCGIPISVIGETHWRNAIRR